MSVNKSDWKQRHQWVLDLRQGGLSVEVVITRNQGEESCAWWVDGFDRGTMQSAKPLHGASLTLKAARRESRREGEAMLQRMLVARGGA